MEQLVPENHLLRRIDQAVDLSFIHALEAITAFTKTPNGRRIYNWRKETIERSFAEVKVNHGFRYARILGIQNMREQSFMTAAVQNIKRLLLAFLSLCINPPPRKTVGLSML